MVTLNEALELIDSLEPKSATQVVPLELSRGRVCAQNYYAKSDMPNFDNSAMDGYAVKLSDSATGVKQIGEIFAGDNGEYSLRPKECYKIMTGAKLPKGCEAVVPIEDVTVDGEKVILPKQIKPRANMRFSGEDLKKDSIVVLNGATLNPYDIGVLASQGYSYIQVYKKLQVSVLSSGHELKPHYEKLKSAQLYNSNAPTLESLAKALECDVYSSNILDDTYEGLKEAFVNCLRSDIIITTGGASVGDKDFTKAVIKDLNAQTVFEKIAIKPGKPTSLYKVNSSYILVLPGNPLAAMVNFELIGKSLIKKLQNANKKYLQQLQTFYKEDFYKKGKKDTIVLGYYDGESFQPLDMQLPGMLKPLQLANAYTVVDAQTNSLKKEQAVGIVLLHADLFTTQKKKVLASS